MSPKKSQAASGGAFRSVRSYEAPHRAGGEGGLRVLVDALWPRGTRKEALDYDEWCKEVAPSTSLRKWFHAHPGGFDEFAARYREELGAKPEAWGPLVEAAQAGQTVSLLYSAHDKARNNAVMLRDYLNQQLKAAGGAGGEGRAGGPAAAGKGKKRGG